MRWALRMLRKSLCKIYLLPPQNIGMRGSGTCHRWLPMETIGEMMTPEFDRSCTGSRRKEWLPRRCASFVTREEHTFKMMVGAQGLGLVRTSAFTLSSAMTYESRRADFRNISGHLWSFVRCNIVFTQKMF